MVDIEGDEFDLFNKDNLRYFKNSFLIIENHENLNKSKKKIVNSFFKILEKNFFIFRIQQNEKNTQCRKHRSPTEKAKAVASILQT